MNFNIPEGIQAAGVLFGMGSASKDARLLRAQGRTARRQAGADADAISREYRQLAGRQAAAIAQSGGSYEGSAVKVLQQSEQLAYLDRLNTIYHGEQRRRDLYAEAAGLEQGANVAGLMQLASIGSGLYTKRKTTRSK